MNLIFIKAQCRSSICQSRRRFLRSQGRYLQLPIPRKTSNRNTRFGKNDLSYS